jgi:hypothetical protein
MEKDLTLQLETVQTNAVADLDPDTARFSGGFLENQKIAIRELSDILTNIKRIAGTPNEALGFPLLDKIFEDKLDAKKRL